MALTVDEYGETSKYNCVSKAAMFHHIEKYKDKGSIEKATEKATPVVVEVD